MGCFKATTTIVAVVVAGWRSTFVGSSPCHGELMDSVGALMDNYGINQ